MILGILGTGLLYVLLGVGLGGALGEQLGKKLGKSPRLFSGIGAGVGLLAVAAFLFISSRQRPDPPPPTTTSSRPSAVVDAGDLVDHSDDGLYEDRASSSADVVAFAEGEAWGDEFGDASSREADDSARETLAFEDEAPGPRRRGLAGAFGQ